MFANARNIQINGGNWVHNNSPSQKIGGNTGLDILRQNVATGAAHDSGERFDPPKCDPNTRVAIIRRIMKWVNNSGTDSSMLWLRGSAGVGKSSLAQTIAELCSKNGRLAGSFFFSRATLDRSDGRLLISTLTYQLTSTFPAARSIIKKTVNRDPLVLQLSLEGQMQTLFIEPINVVARSPIRRYLTHYTRSHPRLVVIDGLDECSDPAVQCEILRVLSSSLQSLRFPFRFLIASRPESHITRSFDAMRPNTRLHEIDLLENTSQADSDIRTFLVKQFKIIRETHPLRVYLPVTWPTREKVDELVRRSSCQFIYASVVMRYIGSSIHRPVERMDIILGLSPRPAQDAPYAQLDELYMHLLSSVENIDIAMKILGILIMPRATMYSIDKYSTPKMLEMVLDLLPGDVELHLINLQSIISIISPTEPVRILHASLGDFLVDPSRAGPKFYVNIGLSHAILTGECIRSVTRNHQPTNPDWDEIIAHLRKAVLTEILLRILLDFPFLAIFDTVKFPSTQIANYIWEWLSKFLSCFDDQSTLFDCKASKKIYTQLLLRLDTYLKNQLARYTVDDEFMDLLTLVTCGDQTYSPSSSTISLRHSISWQSSPSSSPSRRRTPSAPPFPHSSSPTPPHHPISSSQAQQEPFSWHPDLLWNVDEVISNVVLILSGFMRYSRHSKGTSHRHRHRQSVQRIGQASLKLLCQFLLDRERSGVYFVDGAKYACTALRCLRQIYEPRQISSYEYLIVDLCIATAKVLSKASTTSELVAFLTDSKTTSNHSWLKSNIRWNKMDGLETQIQEYLKRANDSPELVK